MLTRFNCEHCSNEFERETNGAAYKFCSRACFHSSRRGRERQARQWIKHSCINCGSEFESLSSAGAKTRFCSRSCQSLHAGAASASLVRSLTLREAAYLAGIVDADGWVMIMPNSGRPTIRVGVAGACLELMNWIVATTGVGHVVRLQKRADSIVKSKKQMYQWSVLSLTAFGILQQIEPFMIEKRDISLRAIRTIPLHKFEMPLGLEKRRYIEAPIHPGRLLPATDGHQGPRPAS